MFSRGTKTALHAAVGFVAFLIAYQVVLTHPAMWWVESAQALSIFWLAFTYALVAGATEIVFRVERSPWRFVSTRDAFLLLRSTVASALIFLLALFILNRAEMLPRSVLLLTWILHLGVLAGMRLTRRAVYEGALNTALIGLGLGKQDGPRSDLLLIIGTVDDAERAIRDLDRDPTRTFTSIAVVTPHRQDRGKLIRNVPVAGFLGDWDNLLPALTRQPDAVLFLNDPTEFLDARQLGVLAASEVTLLRLPRITELKDGVLPQEFPGVREIGIEELLSRPPVTLELSLAKEFIEGKRILVTGAGGSIGAEICRQVASLGCTHLTMLDHAEFLLFTVDREISVAFPRLSRSDVLCNVRDRQRILQWFADEKPDVVFHAAALKHVPLVEDHPDQGVLTNVVGTLNIADAAGSCGARDMVMISTDKAVAPSNVMGATKRLAESVVRAARSEAGTRFTVVRFGNVLGSAGSVVPIFKEQISRGGPVTVTHADVERYFMTIPEAVQLVLHAAATRAQDTSEASDIGIHVLDMGAPVRVHDLAEQMISLSGKVPGKDISIEIIGLRPGEKLTEALVDETEEVVHETAGVIKVADRIRSSGLTPQDVERLRVIAETGNRDHVRAAVYEMTERVRIKSSPMTAGQG